MNGLPVAIQSRDPASAAAEVDSHHPLHVVADFVSFATTFFYVIAHSLRRSSFQNQNRTAASSLVDDFVSPLCRVLILLRLGRSFLCSGDETHHHLRQKERPLVRSARGLLSPMFDVARRGRTSHWRLGTAAPAVSPAASQGAVHGTADHR